MSAAEVIEQIKALTPQEQRQVMAFVRELTVAGDAPVDRKIRYADDGAAKRAGDRIAERYPETFRRLAE